MPTFEQWIAWLAANAAAGDPLGERLLETLAQCDAELAGTVKAEAAAVPDTEPAASAAELAATPIAQPAPVVAEPVAAPVAAPTAPAEAAPAAPAPTG